MSCFKSGSTGESASTLSPRSDTDAVRTALVQLVVEMRAVVPTGPLTPNRDVAEQAMDVVLLRQGEGSEPGDQRGRGGGPGHCGRYRGRCWSAMDSQSASPGAGCGGSSGIAPVAGAVAAIIALLV